MLLTRPATCQRCSDVPADCCRKFRGYPIIATFYSKPSYEPFAKAGIVKWCGFPQASQVKAGTDSATQGAISGLICSRNGPLCAHAAMWLNSAVVPHTAN